MIDIPEYDDSELHRGDGGILLDGQDFLALEDEVKIRPRKPNIIQIEYIDLDFYQCFLYPDQLHEFNDADKLERFLFKKLPTPPSKNRYPQSKEEWIRVAMTTMMNFRIVNIDTEKFTASRVTPIRRRRLR